MANTDLWDRLGKTDPKHTKGFKRAGGFSGTAIKPIYSYRRMTEEYGPCGVGWGMGEPTFQTVPAPEGEVLVYCTVSVWHGDRANTVFGVGGDKAVGKNKYGISTDDEAFKKAFTDAVTNALKMIGVGADVHMGLFEDNKYVNETRQEFAEQRANPHKTLPSDILPTADYDENGEVIDNIPHAEPTEKLRVADQRPLYDALQKEAKAFTTSKAFLAWMNAPVTVDRVKNIKPDWQAMFRGVCKEHLADLRQGEAEAAGDDVRMAG